ncbi:MAG: rhombotarget lipoprotein [Gammaproteobacteria bacterium]|nr:rhombotarget lipoprotein [Gammaproteobacteria bacterium]
MNHLKIATVMSMLLLLSACTALFQPGFTDARKGVSSSLVDYLYPDGETPPEQSDSIPYLTLPLRVGLAFVPSSYSGDSLSDATKMELLDKVSQSFTEHDYVEHIEVIPDTYLRSSNGVDGMQQVARLYGVDAMALVSYDQVLVTNDNKASFLYWTIVGAYIIHGTNNEVQTFVDTAVFDVSTAKLLFRAPGIDKAADRSTAIESRNVSRKQGEESFADAVDAMTVNLGAELVRFEERVAENPQLAQVSWKEGYSGAGSMEGLFLLLLVVFAIVGIGRPSPDTALGNAKGDCPRAVPDTGRPKRPSIDTTRPALP